MTSDQRHVRTMLESRRGSRVNDTVVYNTEAILSRVLCIAATGEIHLESLFNEY